MIALIRPRCTEQFPEMSEPLGAEAICGYLRAHGLACRVFDRRVGASLRDIAACKPEAVGFSLMTEDDVPDALKLLQRLRTPGRLFFAGGLFVTNEPERCRALFPAGTHLIPGEGEGPVLALLTGQNEERPGPNGWAFASRDDLGTYLAGGSVIHLRSSRGCRGNCAFCTTPGIAHQHHETRDIRLVVDEMEQLIGSGCAPVFNFTDDEFGDAARILELIDELRTRKLRAAFSLELRPAVFCQITEDEWRALHAGGLCRVFTGLENLDKQTLRAWHKPTEPEKLLRAIQTCQQSGIRCAAGYILFHEKTTADSALKQVHALYDAGLFSPKAALSRLVLYPGSELHTASGAKSAVLAPLREDAARLYSDWQENLSWLYDLWSQMAIRLPGAACRAFLTGDASEQTALEAALARVNTISYEIIMRKTHSPAQKEALHAICRSALRAR